MDKFEVVSIIDEPENKNAINIFCKDVKSKMVEGEVILYFYSAKINGLNSRLGISPNETQKINAFNNKMILKCYKRIMKLVKLFNKFKVQFSRTIYCIGKCKNDNLSVLETILNAHLISNYKERIAYIYDMSCNIIQDFYTQNNFCDFKQGVCVNRRVNAPNPKYSKNACCKVGCKHMGESGCKTSNLACKFFFCNYLKGKGIMMSPKGFLPTKIYFNHWQRNIAKYYLFEDREKVLQKLYLARYFGPFV